MTVLCPIEPPRRNHHSDRSAAIAITSEMALGFLQGLWDDATSVEPEAFERAAALEAATRLAAVQADHAAWNRRAAPHVRAVLIQEAGELRGLADEMQSAAAYL